MRVRVVMLLGLALLVQGCAVNQFDVSRMEGDGSLRVELADAADHDFRVTVRNLTGIGFDGDRPEDRQRLAAVALQAQCRGLQLVDERPVQRGTYLGGRPRVDFVSRWRCLKS